jgi:hypothetical protein
MNHSLYLEEALESNDKKYLDCYDKCQEQREKIKLFLQKTFPVVIESGPINSGSFAKFTNINAKYDFDIFVGFKKSAFPTLAEMFDTVFNKMKDQSTQDELSLSYVRKQRVSIGLQYEIEGKVFNFDVVPGRLVSEDLSDEDPIEKFTVNLYHEDSYDKVRRSVKTNIKKHINLISGKTSERQVIKLLKILKHEHIIRMKSFLLELFVIKAFEKLNLNSNLFENLISTMKFIEENIQTITLLDPANSGNRVSDTIQEHEKEILGQQFRNIRNNIESSNYNIEEYFPKYISEINKDLKIDYRPGTPSSLNVQNYGHR